MAARTRSRMVHHLQLLAPGAAGRAPCLLLFCDDRRFLFGCGEGTQRVLTECARAPPARPPRAPRPAHARARRYRVRLGKIEHIFVPQTRWACVGGLAGAARRPRAPPLTRRGQAC